MDDERTADPCPESDPVGDLDAVLDAAITAVRAGETQRAQQLCRQALKLEPDNALARYLRAHVAWQTGDEAGAAADFKSALSRDPALVQAHNDLGNLRWYQGRAADAAACYRDALAAEPAFTEAHNNLGVALRDLGELDDAIASFRAALARQPAHATAHYNLCGLLERTNRLDALREAVAAARESCPESPYVAIRAAQMAVRDGDHAQARRVLAAIEPPPGDLALEGEQHALLAHVCDRLDEPDAAFEHARESNRCQRLAPAAGELDPVRYRAHLARLTKRFRPDWVAKWRDIGAPPDARPPVFLVGFPRSGTTLLDTILRSHPDVGVIEEQGGVSAMLAHLTASKGEHPEALEYLSADDAAAMRGAYWDEMARHLPDDAWPPVIVDKLPLNVAEAGAIHRVFPGARFLFVQRHPCDCVLSAFMHAFRLNDAMANFLRLRDTATLYDAVMRLWTQYREVLPLNVTTVVYEDLTTDFEATLSPVLDALGLAWTDDLYAHHETARRRAKINTPSYSEVTQPIHGRARGRWTRYRDHLEPVLPTLLPWAEHLRYGEDDGG